MNDRISELAALIADRIPALIEEARDQINEAINAAVEDAQERENGKAVLSLAITAKWDLDGNAVVISMPVAVRRKFEVTAALEDPNQEHLPFVEAPKVAGTVVREDWTFEVNDLRAFAQAHPELVEITVRRADVLKMIRGGCRQLAHARIYTETKVGVRL